MDVTVVRNIERGKREGVPEELSHDLRMRQPISQRGYPI